MSVYNKRGILLLPKVIVLNPKDGNSFLEYHSGIKKSIKSRLRYTQIVYFMLYSL